LRTGEPDLPFCLAWANESWTGIWHGQPNRVLIEQTYPGLRDHELHFCTLLEAFEDDRYLTIDGRPIFLIYRPHQLPGSREVTDLWRDLARRSGLKGLYLIGITQNEAWIPEDYGFDAMSLSNQTKLATVLPKHLGLRLWRKLLRRSRVSYLYKRVCQRPIHVYQYREALPYFVVTRELACTYHPCVIPNWDNTPRSGREGFVLHRSDPELFRIQVQSAVRRVKAQPWEHRLVFVKSWNEWAEGNHLEPDQRFGRAYLEVIRDAV
jgi:hypothetical protein